MMQFIIILLSFLLIGLSNQVENAEVEITTITATTEVTNETASCNTAKGIKGVCTARERCDYGPNNIDFTLYAPRGYKRPCSLKEVCCPAEYITVQEEPFEKENANFED